MDTGNIDLRLPIPKRRPGRMSCIGKGSVKVDKNKHIKNDFYKDTDYSS